MSEQTAAQTPNEPTTAPTNGLVGMIGRFSDRLSGGDVAPKTAVPAEFRSNDTSFAKQELTNMMQQFLQNFEYVELMYPVSGVVKDSATPVGHHPHIIFRMCGDDRKAMTADQRGVVLGRQIDRGTAMIERLGQAHTPEPLNIALDDWYVDQARGELQFDAKIPNPPEGMSEEMVLRNLTDALQEACTKARAARGQQGAER